MAPQALPFEIRETKNPDGDLLLELVVEGSRLARARASAEVLADMHSMLGLDRDAVAEQLRGALLEFLKNQLATVSVAEPIEDPSRKLRFASRYTLRSGEELSTGVVWYDVTESTTGPDQLPAVVRNKMRHEVHRKLNEPGTAARALVDLHK